MDVNSLPIENQIGLEKLPRQSMKDIVAEKLSLLIASGLLEIGDALPAERDLATALGVSRETIRGAILILSTKGILSVTQGARSTVASNEIDAPGLLRATGSNNMRRYSLDDVHQTRLKIEAEVSRLSVINPKKSDLVRLGNLIVAQEKATEDPIRFLILDREFHTIIYRACGNEVLADIATTLYSYQLDHRRRVVTKPGTIARSISDHYAILTALEAKNAEKLSAAFEVHEWRIYETTRQLKD
ncbi:MAG: FCD domain-containing protein [Aestuariivita sp.]|nr:FCD domain-containing protein [Aestuariivita sp.]